MLGCRTTSFVSDGVLRCTLSLRCKNLFSSGRLSGVVLCNLSHLPVLRSNPGIDTSSVHYKQCQCTLMSLQRCSKKVDITITLTLVLQQTVVRPRHQKRMLWVDFLQYNKNISQTKNKVPSLALHAIEHFYKLP